VPEVNADPMNNRMLRSALIALAIAAPAFAQAPAKKVDVTGKWAFSVATDNGTGTPTVTFTQKGDSVTGHYSSQLLGEVDFKGTVKDGKIAWTMTVSVQGQSLAVSYAGTVESADTMKGTVDLGGMGGGTFTGTRQKP
jgi:hypothetical protein